MQQIATAVRRPARAGLQKAINQEASEPYFRHCAPVKGFFMRADVVQDYMLGALNLNTYRVWDWLERTLCRQRNYHPEQRVEDPALQDHSIADIQKQLNKNARLGQGISRRSLERALAELKLKGFLAIEARFKTTADGSRQQVASAYRLRCPPALRVLLIAVDNSRRPAAKSSKNPPSRMAQQTAKTSEKKKEAKQEQSLPSISTGGPSEKPPTQVGTSPGCSPEGGYRVIADNPSTWVSAPFARLRAIAGLLIHHWCIQRKYQFEDALRWLAEAEKQVADKGYAIILGEQITEQGLMGAGT